MPDDRKGRELGFDNVPQAYAGRLRALYANPANRNMPAYLGCQATAGRDAERIVFINSIGGLGDSFPMLMAIQLYKKYFPQDITLLYDSMFVHHYFGEWPFVDEVYRAAEHFHTSYALKLILDMDPTLPREGGVNLADTGYSKLVSTHHAHQRRFYPEERVVRMDWATVETDFILQGLAPLRMRLRHPFQSHIDGWLRILKSDGRPLIAIQNRAQNVYRTLQIDGEQYKRELETLAESLVVRHNARVLLLGDTKLESPSRYASGDWVDLDNLVRNIYFKFEILRQCDYVFGSPSGFSFIVNLMRGPEQSPAIILYANERLLIGKDLQELYPDYCAEGGGVDHGLVMTTYQHPALADFIFDTPHTPGKALAFLERLMAERASGSRPGWLVPHD